MYDSLYKEIIDNAKQNNRVKGGDVYYEAHHIIPDFMFKYRKRKGPSGHLDGDPDAPHNIVLLTFREHLMAHYYLAKSLEGTRYEFAAGSALQFFFTKAVGKHTRQMVKNIEDEEFLKEMTHVRELGISSISNARKGKMSVVCAVTGKKIGSVPVDHHKVLSGEWVHHSKGKPWSDNRRTNAKSQKGHLNTNFKELTDERKMRVFDCVRKSCEYGMFKPTKFKKELKREFTEFKKISQVWVLNNFESYENLISVCNQTLGTDYKYEQYFFRKKNVKN